MQPVTTSKDPGEKNTLRTRLQTLMLLAAGRDCKGNPSEHPVAVINAVKNIISDTRDENHDRLLENLENWIMSFNEINNPEEILEKTRKNATGEAIFVSELTEAVQAGDKNAATELAARIHLAAMSPTLVQESMSEAFLQKMDIYGPFCFHWLRVNNFLESDKHIWSITAVGLTMVGRNILPGPAAPSELPDFQKILRFLLRQGEVESFAVFMAGVRILEHGYVRTRKFRNEVSCWMHSLQLDGENDSQEEPDESVPDMKPKFGEMLHTFTKKGSINARKIVEIEAFRACFRIAEKETLPVLWAVYDNWKK